MQRAGLCGPVTAGAQPVRKVHRVGYLALGSLQLTFDPEAFTVMDAARFCEDARLRYLAAGPGRRQ